MQDEKYFLFLKSRTLPCILLLASISWSIRFPLPGVPGFSVFTPWPVTHVFFHWAATASSLLNCFSTSPHKNLVAISREPTSVLYTHHTYWWSGLSTSCCRWVVSDSCDPMDCNPPGSSVMGFLSGKNTGVGCHFLLQGTFPTQGSNLHCRRIPYCLRRQGSKQWRQVLNRIGILLKA